MLVIQRQALKFAHFAGSHMWAASFGQRLLVQSLKLQDQKLVWDTPLLNVLVCDHADMWRAWTSWMRST